MAALAKIAGVTRIAQPLEGPRITAAVRGSCNRNRPDRGRKKERRALSPGVGPMSSRMRGVPLSCGTAGRARTLLSIARGWLEELFGVAIDLGQDLVSACQGHEECLGRTSKLRTFAAGQIDV